MDLVRLLFVLRERKVEAYLSAAGEPRLRGLTQLLTPDLLADLKEHRGEIFCALEDGGLPPLPYAEPWGRHYRTDPLPCRPVLLKGANYPCPQWIERPAGEKFCSWHLGWRWADEPADFWRPMPNERLWWTLVLGNDRHWSEVPGWKGK